MIKNDCLDTKRTSSRCVFYSLKLVCFTASAMYVAALYRDLRMAALTKRHEVALLVHTTVCQRQDVMRFLGGSEPAFAFALLAQRMQYKKSRAEFLPRAAVSFIGVRIAKVTVVLSFGDVSMFVAVLTVC